jgi:hypothetical protein
MTIVLAFQALDGLVVCADGLTTHRPEGAEPFHQYESDTTALKLVRVPNREIAVLLTGRAQFPDPRGLQESERAGKMCQRLLSRESAPGGRLGHDAEVRTVAQMVQSYFAGAFIEARLPASDTDLISGVVAGYSPSGSAPQVWRLIPHDSGPPIRVGRFDDEKFCFVPDDRIAGDIIEAELTASQPGTPIVSRPAKEIISCLETLLPALVEHEHDHIHSLFQAIGGRWQLLHLSDMNPGKEIVYADALPWRMH